MLNKVVRVGILLMLVVVLALAVVGAKAAQLESVNQVPPCGLITPPLKCTIGEVYGVPWNGSYDPATWDKSQLYTLSFGTQAKTYGELKAEYESKLGYPIVMLAKVYDVAYASVGAGISWSPFAGVAPTHYILPDPSMPLPLFGVNVAIFKDLVKGQENLRLTLFGYANSDGKSCVLWSLDGSRNVDVAKKCGGDAELVCTVKLVGKELEYDCQGDYDWLGEQIVNDPKWLEWANKFASMNGKK